MYQLLHFLVLQLWPGELQKILNFIFTVLPHWVYNHKSWQLITNTLQFVVVNCMLFVIFALDMCVLPMINDISFSLLLTNDHWIMNCFKLLTTKTNKWKLIDSFESHETWSRHRNDLRNGINIAGSIQKSMMENIMTRLDPVFSTAC